MTKKQKLDGAIRFNTCDTIVDAPWSDLNHDVLFFSMMQLGVIDFLSFSGVCKSWRSLALSNKKFMASIPPMSIHICNEINEKEYYCYLDDCHGRKYKSILPHSADTEFVGLACGYLVMLSLQTNDYRLVNPITRHELYFPAIPCSANFCGFKANLVFSPSTHRWVLIVIRTFDKKIWFSISGTKAWTHVSSTFPIIDLHAFKGKIYTLDNKLRVCEVRLNPVPKLTLLTTKNVQKEHIMIPVFVSSDDNLFVTDYLMKDPFEELDFGEMKWVSPKEETIGEYAFFRGDGKYDVVFKPEWSRYKRYDYFFDAADKSLKGKFFAADMWYFPHDCFNADIMDER